MSTLIASVDLYCRSISSYPQLHYIASTVIKGGLSRKLQHHLHKLRNRKTTNIWRKSIRWDNHQQCHNRIKV